MVWGPKYIFERPFVNFLSVSIVNKSTFNSFINLVTSTPVTSTRLSRRRPYMNTSHNTQPFSLLTVVVVRVYELRGSEEDIKVIHFNHTSRYRFCGVFNKDRSYMMNIYTTVHIYERLEKKRWDLRKNTLRRKRI